MNTVDELLIDLADGNPVPRGIDWFSRDCFDPMHGLTEIKYAEARGWIACERKNNDIRFKLTPLAIEIEKTWPPHDPADSTTTLLKARNLVRDLVGEGVEEKWIPRDDFDPPHRMSEIRKAAKMSFIEVGEGEQDELPMRLTAIGRSHLAEILMNPESVPPKASEPASIPAIP